MNDSDYIELTGKEAYLQWRVKRDGDQYFSRNFGVWADCLDVGEVFNMDWPRYRRLRPAPVESEHFI